MTGSGSLTLEQAIVAALAAGDEDAAAMMLRRAFGRGPTPGHADLPELLEELAEYFASLDRPEDGVAAAARALLLTTSEGGEREVLRRRCRIAGMLLKIGLPDEACTVYAGIAEAAPGETWVHEAAGSDYVEADDHELAFAWLTAGLEQAIANEEPPCVARLIGLRRLSMDALGLRRDDLDRLGSALIDAPHALRTEADDIELVIKLDGDGVASQRVIELLECLRSDDCSSVWETTVVRTPTTRGASS